MIESLVIVEHSGGSLKRSSLNAAALAGRLGGSFAFAVLGNGIDAIAESVRAAGASIVLLADSPDLAEPLADKYAAVLAAMARKHGIKNLIGTSSTFTKDILPRAAALLDAPMLSDVTAVETIDGETVFQRLINAGSLLATVKLDGDIRVFSVRGSAFHPLAKNGEQCPIEKFEVDQSSLPNGTRFVSRDTRSSSRPELTEARVVVSGGRPLKDRETFDRLIGGLADSLSGAVGATRAAVDAGMAPNDFQVGQTGKAVAPELYIAVGVSGAIQHTAGIMDSKVIVAINRDPEAPVFQIANYGLVGDLYDLVPQLISAVRS